MKQYVVRMTPNCESRFRALAFARWLVSAGWVKLAFYCISAAMLVSDDFDIEVWKEEVPE